MFEKNAGQVGLGKNAGQIDLILGEVMVRKLLVATS